MQVVQVGMFLTNSLRQYETNQLCNCCRWVPCRRSECPRGARAAARAPGLHHGPHHLPQPAPRAACLGAWGPLHSRSPSGSQDCIPRAPSPATASLETGQDPFLDLLKQVRIPLWPCRVKLGRTSGFLMESIYLRCDFWSLSILTDHGCWTALLC